MDPIVLPDYSSYSTFGCNPIVFSDPSGANWWDDITDFFVDLFGGDSQNRSTHSNPLEPKPSSGGSSGGGWDCFWRECAPADDIYPIMPADATITVRPHEPIAKLTTYTPGIIKQIYDYDNPVDNPLIGFGKRSVLGTLDGINVTLQHLGTNRPYSFTLDRYLTGYNERMDFVIPTLAMLHGSLLNVSTSAMVAGRSLLATEELPKLRIPKFDVLDLEKVSGDDLFNYAKAFENSYKAGKVTGMTRSEAAYFVRLLRRKGVPVVIDQPHLPPNPWQMKHLNVGEQRIHIPILD